MKQAPIHVIATISGLVATRCPEKHASLVCQQTLGLAWWKSTKWFFTTLPW